jgi:hypothetical protein
MLIRSSRYYVPKESDFISNTLTLKPTDIQDALNKLSDDIKLASANSGYGKSSTTNVFSLSATLTTSSSNLSSISLNNNNNFNNLGSTLSSFLVDNNNN